MSRLLYLVLVVLAWGVEGQYESEPASNGTVEFPVTDAAVWEPEPRRGPFGRFRGVTRRALENTGKGIGKVVRPLRFGSGLVQAVVVGTMGQAVGSVRDGARKVLGRGPREERAAPVIVMAENQHHLIAGILRRELVPARTVPSPLVRLFSKTLWSRRRTTRVRLLEHMLLLVVSVHWTMERLRDSPRWLYALNLVFWAYVTWSMAEASRSVLVEKLLKLLDQRIRDTKATPDPYESVHWVNRVIRQAWSGSIEPALSQLVERNLDALFQRNKPANVSRLDVTEMSFGHKPPEVQYVRLLNLSSIPPKGYSLVRNLTSKPSKTVVMELMVRYVSEGSRMKIRFVDGASRPFITLRPTRPALLTVSDVTCVATLVLVFEVLKRSPYIRLRRMAFMGRPALDFALRPIGPLDVTAVPILSQAVSYIVDQALSPLIEPSYLEFPPARSSVAAEGPGPPSSSQGH